MTPSLPLWKLLWIFRIATDHQGSFWVGFTAVTGWGFENHDILNWALAGATVSSSVSMVSSDISFPMSACLPNRNLCTPEQAIVEHNTAVLPYRSASQSGMGRQYPQSQR
jgi:hypothetical protein